MASSADLKAHRLTAKQHVPPPRAGGEGAGPPRIEDLMRTMTGVGGGPAVPPPLEPTVIEVPVEVRVEVPVPMPLVKDDQGNLWSGNFCITARGLVVDGNVTPEEFQMFFDLLAPMAQSLMLIMCDYLAFGENKKYGVSYPRAAAAMNTDIATITNNVYICKSVEISIRKENLTLSHYALVAAMPHEKQAYWLNMASKSIDGKPWSKRQLEAAIEGKPLPKGGKPARSNFWDRFERAFDPFSMRIQKMALKAPPQDREAMARRLREMAEALDPQTEEVEE